MLERTLDRNSERGPAGSTRPSEYLPRTHLSGPESLVLRLQRLCGNRHVQRVMTPPENAAGDVEAIPEVETAIEHSRGMGRVLDSRVREQMQAVFGADFTSVRVHTDVEADMLNRTLSARAFTTGQDIFFREGEYSPGSSTGRELLAHELTHVVQQTRSAVPRKLVVRGPDDRSKEEANRVARASVQQDGESGSTQPSAPVSREGTIQRAPVPGAEEGKQVSEGAHGGSIVPAIKVKREFELEGESVPEGPVKVGVGAKLKFDGTIRYGNPAVQFAFTPGKAEVEFQQEVATEYGHVKVKGAVEPGKLSKIGIAVGTESFEVEFEASPDLKLKIEFPVASREVHVGFGDLFFDGKIEGTFEVLVSPNPLWPGWATAARGAIQAGRTVVSAARGLLYTGEAGTATTGAAVATAALVAVTYIAWVGYGLYQIGKAHEKGLTLAIGYSFSNGYSRMLANLTSDVHEQYGRETISAYLDMDWKGVFEEQSRAYIAHRDIGEAIYAAEQVEKAGAAAILQDSVNFVASNGADAWKNVRAHHQAVYGRAFDQRRHRYLTILYQQVQSGAIVGIPIA